jgi:signal transduction histidine kinase
VVVSSSRVDSEWVRISVRDNGPGFRGELPETIFEPFYTTKATGMGMGLFVSRSIVESHGGRLRAENDPEGGAVFSFTVPMDSTSDPREGT